MGASDSKPKGPTAEEILLEEQRKAELNDAVRAEQDKAARELNAAKVAAQKKESEATQTKHQLEIEKMALANQQTADLMEIQRKNADHNLQKEQQHAEIVRKMHETERTRADNQRTENDKKIEAARIEARDREEKTRLAAEQRMEAANKMARETEQKAHSDINKMVMENQRQKDELAKENRAALDKKEEANAAKLEMMQEKYTKEMNQTKEEAMKREDKLRLERNTIDKEYKIAMEKKDQMTREEREKTTAEYNAKITAKDKELSDHHRTHQAKMDEIHREHNEQTGRMQADMLKLQKDHLADVDKLHRENQELQRQKEAQNVKHLSDQKAFQDVKNKEVLALTQEVIFREAIKLKESTEIISATKYNDELGPLQSTKTALMTTVNECNKLWGNLSDSNKQEIIRLAQDIKKHVNQFIVEVDRCRALDADQELWKSKLVDLDDSASVFEKAVRREIMKADEARLAQLEDQCDALKKQINALPQLARRGIENMIAGHAADAIKLAESRAGAAPAAVKEAPTTSVDEQTDEQVVEEPK